MGFGGKSDKKMVSSGAVTVIADGSSIEGQFKLASNIHIDGKVKGDIETEFTVTISASGSVDGVIKADRLIVSGVFTGNVESNSVEILENGLIKGEVSTRAFVISKGGSFLGSSKKAVSKDTASLDSIKKVSNL